MTIRGKAILQWDSGLDGHAVKELQEIAREINKQADIATNVVVQAKMGIGHALIEARQYYDNDAQFGMWREANTPIDSAREASYCMNIARRFSNAEELIKETSWSVLRELTHAGDDVVEQIEAKVKAGEKPTVKEVRNEVKASKQDSPTSAEEPKEVTGKEGQHKAEREMTFGKQERPPSPEERVQNILLADIVTRFAYYQDNRNFEGAAVFLGLDPWPSCMPAQNIAGLAMQSLKDNADHYGISYDHIDEAYNYYMSEYNQ